MLSLVIAPNPIFKKKALPVSEVTDQTRETINKMFDLMYTARGIGMASNMVGLLERIIIVDLQDDEHPRVAMINPEVIETSEESQTHTEASLCFPGINVDITRPKAATIRYLDEQGEEKTLSAEGWFAQVILHEMDYLDGRTILDHVSKLQRDRLIKKMEKYKKSYDRAHDHGDHCGPGCGHSH